MNTGLTNEKTGLLILKVIAEKPDSSKEAFQPLLMYPIRSILAMLRKRVWID
jgi:hypothetical protein